jgi:hypothetical protein
VFSWLHFVGPFKPGESSPAGREQDRCNLYFFRIRHAAAGDVEGGAVIDRVRMISRASVTLTAWPNAKRQ